ncbi:Nitroreductase [Tistlia consotensis]|uniref:Putative NAD(P)H nitroreductase n=1 Tax=Tistlia consotensis USBA 355 TaxID=560819 RepID=A0A1Y6BLQ6_9PROT|nr:nitroreductase [Tistlia consotensis]SMF09055.1 Nitroreductase [Tistlia consotensis USBA 355]SNR34879.1 Nitroreductase [Tistlia consotensis]
MEALDAILTRRSVPAQLLKEPAPSDDELAEVFAAAVTAPDHGAIRPWRFAVIRGEGLERLADLFGEALRRREPEVGEEVVEEARKKALRSPLVIAVWAEIREGHPKVPPIEQVVSTGAAVQNMLVALHAKGYGAIQLTGPNAHDPFVKAAFGLQPKDELVGFVYVGTPTDPQPAKRRPEASDFVRQWHGAQALDAAAD